MGRPEQDGGDKKPDNKLQRVHKSEHKHHDDGKKRTYGSNSAAKPHSRSTWGTLAELKNDKPKSKQDELRTKIKVLWEKARSRRENKEARQSAINKILVLLGDKVAEYALKHDLGRVFQTCLKQGTHDQRVKIITMLKDHVVDLSFGHYGKFLCRKLFQYANARDKRTMADHVILQAHRLIKQKEGVDIINELYESGDRDTKVRLMQAMYGPAVMAGLVSAEDPKKTDLQSILEKHPEQREKLCERINSLIRVGREKGTIRYVIFHRLLMELLKNAPETSIMDIVKEYGDVAADILHTFEGAQAVITMIHKSGAKERKIIIKSMKDYVTKVARDSYGHGVLVALFKYVDDTVLLNKSLISELSLEMTDLLKDPFGSRVILASISPSSPFYLVPWLRTLFDSLGESPTSHKESKLRADELLTALAPTLRTVCIESCAALLASESGSIVAETASRTTPSAEEKDNDLYVKILEVLSNDLELAKDGTLKPIYSRDDNSKTKPKTTKSIKGHDDDKADDEESDDEDKGEDEEKPVPAPEAEVKTAPETVKYNAFVDIAPQRTIRNIIKWTDETDRPFSRTFHEKFQSEYKDIAKTNKGCWLLASLVDSPHTHDEVVKIIKKLSKTINMELEGAKVLIEKIEKKIESVPEATTKEIVAPVPVAEGEGEVQGERKKKHKSK